MSKNTNRANSAKASSVEVEKTNNNKPQDSAPVSVPAPSSEEPSTKEEPIQLTIEDKTDRPKFEGRRVPVTVQPDLSSKGWRDLPAGTILRITERFSDKAHSNGLPYWTGEIETPGRLIRFCDKTITEIKSWYGDTNIQRGGSHKIVHKGCKSPEDVDSAVYAYEGEWYAAIKALKAVLEKSGKYAAYACSEEGYSDDTIKYFEVTAINVKGEKIYENELHTILKNSFRAIKEKELDEYRAKLDEAAKKQAAKDLKNASEADRIKAAEYLSLSDIAKQITEAAAVCDWDRVAELAAEQSRLQAEAAKVTEAANNDGVNETAA